MLYNRVPRLATILVSILVVLFPLGFALFFQLRHLLQNNSAPSYWSLIPLFISLVSLTFLVARTQDHSRLGYILTGVVIAFFALSIRLALITLFSTRVESDFWDIHRFAVDLATGQGTANVEQYTFIPRVTYVNMTAVVLSIFYRLTSPDIRLGKLLMAVLSMLSAFILYLAAARVYARQFAGIIAALFFSCLPALAVYTGLTSMDHFAILVINLSLYVYAIASEHSPAWSWAAVLGLLTGLIDWFRPVGSVLIIAILITDWIIPSRTQSPLLKRLGCSMVLVLVFTLVSGASVQLSRFLFKTPLASNTQQMGRFLYIGFNFETGGMYSDADNNLVEQVRAESAGDFSVFNRHMLDLAQQRIQDHPGQVPGLLARKIEKVWANSDQLFEFALNGSNDQEVAGFLAGFDAYLTLWITFLVVVSLAFNLRGLPARSVFAMQLFILGVALLLLITEVQTRYRLVLVPPLMILAAGGMIELSGLRPKLSAPNWRPRRHSDRTTAQK